MTDLIVPETTPMDGIQLPLMLSVRDLNYLLKVLAKRPLEECQDVFNRLQQQGNAGVQAARQAEVERLKAAEPAAGEPQQLGVDLLRADQPNPPVVEAAPPDKHSRRRR